MPSVAKRHAHGTFLLALHVGITSVRAELFDHRARDVQGTAVSAEGPVKTTPDGGAEIDPDALFEMTCDVVDKALMAATKGLGARLDISGVGISTFWHSTLGIDEHNRPTTPLFLWADSRARDQMPILRAKLDE